MDNPASPTEDPGGRPLYVDLDGTLVRTDILHESALLRLRRSPLAVLPMLGHLLRGRAALKQWLSQDTCPDATLLPYRAPVLAAVTEARKTGRRVVLATATHEASARRVADHLGLFDDVLGTTAEVNLKGSRKLEAIQQDAGGAFDYIGDAQADLPIFAQATRALLVAPSRGLLARVQAVCDDVAVLEDPVPRGRMLVKALRPHQWMKNVLLFVPAVLAHSTLSWDLASTLLLGFLTFSLSASAVYVMNDLADIESDRRHGSKSRRPFACGGLPIPWAPPLIFALLAVGVGISLWTLPSHYTLLLGGYLVLNLLYSFWLRSKLLVDVFVLAGLYTWRILAGGAIAGVEVSEWLIAMSVFAFTSLAFVKRQTELLRTPAEGQSSRGYLATDIGIIETVGPASGYLAVLVMALYLSSDTVKSLYVNPKVLWLVCPLLMYWFTRIWFLAKRGQVHDDPLVFVLRDGVSRVVVVLVVLIAILASINL